MPVLLVLQPTQKAPYYPPLLSALERLKGERVLKSAWIFEQATAAMVSKIVEIHLPISDGYLLMEGSEIERRTAGKRLVVLQ